MEEELSLVELFKTIKKRVVLIINMVLVGLALAAAYTFFIATPQFSATTQLLVNRTQDTEVIQRADIDTNVQLINTYSDIIRNPIILDPVIETLNINQTSEQLKDEINITTATNSQVFSLQVTDDNPYAAAEIANTISSVFKENLDSIMKIDNVTIISEAMVNTNPISPNNILNLVLGSLLGGLIGVGVAFLLEFLDTSVKDTKFIVDELGWTNLGSISMMSPKEMESEVKKSVPQRKNESGISRTRI